LVRNSVAELSEKAPSELLETIVTRLFGPSEDASHVFAELWLAPVVAGGTLGARGVALARRFEQR